MSSLESLGWSAEWAETFTQHSPPNCVPGRVAVEHRGLYAVFTADGEGPAVVSGRLRFDARGRADFPAVGDWVALQRESDDSVSVIHAVLPRANRFSRTQPGNEHDEQIIAANLDTLFIVTSVNRDLNPNRIERYLAAANAPALRPVIVLTKLDLCDRPDDLVESIRSRIPAVDLVAVSGRTGEGMGSLEPFLGPGQTVAMVGMSGVGKSTLINRLVGEDRLATAEIRAADDRGRHTTTRRELIRLPHGGLLIDNPGMRELQLWDEGTDTGAAFDDLSDLASRCRFTDCRHKTEPGCAIRQALEDGTLSTERLESFDKLRREQEYLRTREDPRLEREKKARWRAIHRSLNKVNRNRDRR